MRHLKKFEHFSGFDLGRFSEEEEETNFGYDQPVYPEDIEKIEREEECEPCDYKEEEDFYSEEEEDSEEEEEMKSRVWGDEQTVERISTFRQFEAKKSKPDFLDLDKDGDKKESMKKAAKDAKDKKGSKKEDKEDKEEKGGKGLTAAQKKLPEGLRKAIEARKKK